MTYHYFIILHGEQKAFIVFLSLLYLDVKNIHVGPTLPAFLSENVRNMLIEKFNIGGITNTIDDINMFLQGVETEQTMQ